MYGELPSAPELARWDEALMRHSAVPLAVEVCAFPPSPGLASLFTTFMWPCTRTCKPCPVRQGKYFISRVFGHVCMRSSCPSGSQWPQRLEASFCAAHPAVACNYSYL